MFSCALISMGLCKECANSLCCLLYSHFPINFLTSYPVWMIYISLSLLYHMNVVQGITHFYPYLSFHYLIPWSHTSIERIYISNQSLLNRDIKVRLCPDCCKSLWSVSGTVDDPSCWTSASFPKSSTLRDTKVLSQCCSHPVPGHSLERRI